MNTILDYDKPGMEELPTTANTGARFVNFILDRIVSSILGYGGMFGAMAAFGEESGSVIGLLLFALGYFGYYIIMEYNFEGKTIAKMLTKTRAIQEDGSPITLGQAVGRTFARLIPFEPFSIFFTNGGTACWHDTLAGTLVVQD